MTELESIGLRFEIDHYLPSSKFREIDKKYENLMWSCEQCNIKKGKYYPTADLKKKGYYIIRVDEEDPRDHIIISELNELRVEPITKTGEFNINRLDLNRQTLRRVRKTRKEFRNSGEHIAHGIRELMGIRMDQLPRQHRLRFIQLKQYLISNDKNITGEIEELIRQVSCSPLLDEDEDKKERLKARRAYLNQINALNDDMLLPKSIPSKASPKKRTKKKRRKK